jgi:hypothetical protein
MVDVDRGWRILNFAFCISNCEKRYAIRNSRFANGGRMKETKPVEVYRASGELEAQVIRAKLEAAGIRAIFQNEALGTLGFTLDGLGEFRILVAPQDEQAARAILSEPASADESDASNSDPQAT